MQTSDKVDCAALLFSSFFRTPFLSRNHHIVALFQWALLMIALKPAFDIAAGRFIHRKMCLIGLTNSKVGDIDFVGVVKGVC